MNGCALLLEVAFTTALLATAGLVALATGAR